ncbi:MAG: InlB B-repeat-containing protein, partial [Prevotella sp.]
VKNETIDFASVITAPENPTKEGYTFKGWFAGETQFVEGATVPVGGITYEAKWQINQYTITFDTDGGSEVASITQDYNTAVTAPANPTKTGYTFVAWDNEIPATMPAENITIKATWKINQYTITFNSNGGSEVASITQDYATEITAPTAPTRVGYDFAGWDKEVPATMPAEDLTLTAQWTAKKFTYTFTKKDNKDNVASDVIELEQTFDAAVVMPTAEQLNWEGHTFDKYVESVPETVTEEGAKTFTALYNINKYTVKFVVGEDIHEAILEYGTKITVPEIPAKEGYTGAWDKVVAETVPAEDVTYTAVYTPIEYTVTFNTDGGSEIASIKVAYGSAITLPENPTKEGYTFKEWENVPETMPAKDVELKAIWTINKYIVTFDFGFNELYDEKEYEYNAEIVIPDVPVRAGWKFIGWNPEVDATVPAHDVTYTAQWELDVVKVRFVFWDDNMKEYEYKPGAEITEIPEVPAREGYTFKGWDMEIPKVVPETGGELVITAVWSINKYAVYFIANKKTIYSETLPYGTPIVAPEAPEVEGYTFVGWTPEVDVTVPARTVYYEAVYEINTYKVTYYLNDEVVNVAEVKYGEEIPAYEPTVEAGMKFDGWQEEIPAVMPAYDLEIHGTTSGIETAIKNIVAKFGETFDVYNVSGRLVQRVNGASDITRIPAGMYIINGTKVVIRKD